MYKSSLYVFDSMVQRNRTALQGVHDGKRSNWTFAGVPVLNHMCATICQQRLLLRDATASTRQRSGVPPANDHLNAEHYHKSCSDAAVPTTSSKCLRDFDHEMQCSLVFF
ncbi:hypothetical protein ANCCAN_07270 [Ancylostoma caninum]|uniref:Uncharacterized protein n=1 Tax=Ancylostoma caninum TaxID=29170 RepID=A0A368GQI7_ANCCA|nr:hypothetical protein ANCCAN_07270 [Ancylostoma caninum]